MQFFIKVSLSVLCILVTPAGKAWNTLTSELDMTCTQTGETLLNCNYRLLSTPLARNISASSGQGSLNIIKNTPFTASNWTSAILFVVDTSDPARQNVINKNIEHIEKLLSAGQSHHIFGLASFDKHLKINAPMGSSRFQIINASKQLQATGKTTELYRNVIKAIEVIAAVKADRKAIILFSDGQAEDRAYYHQDVINSARKSNVIINSLGYPRSVSLSVALQTIRRLSEESGGLFTETDDNFNLPFSYLNAPFKNIDSGGRFVIDLSPVIKTTLPEREQITLSIDASNRKINTQIPITNPMATSLVRTIAMDSSATPREMVQQQPVIRIIAPTQEAREIDKWLWYGIPIAFLVLIILTVIILIVLYHQQKTSKAPTGTSATDGYKPYAYLVVQDETGLRYPITNTTWRIGRTKDNELSLNDKSVSRRHAEIQRYSNGNFVVFDVDSLNGVYVNSEQVKKKKLKEGDIIEIGDIFLRFTTYSNDHQIEEDTQVQNTRAPIAS